MAEGKRLLNRYGPQRRAVMTDLLRLVAVQRDGPTHWVISPQEAHKGILSKDILF